MKKIILIFILFISKLFAGADLLNIEEVSTSIADSVSEKLQEEFTENIVHRLYEELQLDYAKRNNRNSVFGQQVIGQEVTQFSALFAYPSDTRKLMSTVTNGGNVSQANSLLILSTGTNIAGTAYASSKRALQYIPGKEGYAKFTAIFSTGKENSRQKIGLFGIEDGFAIGMEGTKFAVFRIKGSSIVETITQENFNLDKLDGTGNSGFNIDITKGNVFRIAFGYLGFASIYYEILSENGWICFHKINFPNKNTTTNINLPYLKLGATVENTGNNTDIILKTASVEAGVIDGTGLLASTRDFTRSTSASFTAQTNFRYVVYHSKSTYGGITNKIEALLNVLTGAIEANKTFRWDLYKLAAAPTGGTWTDAGPNSFMEISYDTTISLTNAEKILTIPVGKSAQFFYNIEYLNLRLLPDEYLALVYTTTGAGDLEIGVRWKELF